MFQMLILRYKPIISIVRAIGLLMQIVKPHIFFNHKIKNMMCAKHFGVDTTVYLRVIGFHSFIEAFVGLLQYLAETHQTTAGAITVREE